MASPALFRRILALPPALRRSFFASAAHSHIASSSSTSDPEIYDIVCVGGGPAGLSLLSALKAHPSTTNLKTALIDAQDVTKAKDATFAEDIYSNRCSSLTPSSVRFLRRTGVWRDVDGTRTAPYHAMEVWDGVSGSKIHFEGAEARRGLGLLDALGQLVPGNRFSTGSSGTREEPVVATMCENANLTRGLMQSLLGEDQSLDMLSSTSVESISFGPEAKDDTSVDLSQWPLVNAQTPRGPRTLAARLLVGADGANSPVRRFADIPSHGWDYGQQGVVATLDLDQDLSPQDRRTAFQRFLPTGPIALLPLPGNKASLVWSTTPAHAARLKQLDPEDFAAMINAAFRLMPIDVDYMLGPAIDVSLGSELSWRESNTSSTSTGLPLSFPRVVGVQSGTVASFPLRMRHASTYTGHRVALIGDAAHTIHPLAGQGLNLGLADAEALADRIAYGVEHGMDIGSEWCLDPYNAARWAANNAMLGAVDKLQKVYGFGSGPVVWGRSLGVDVLDKLSGVKGLMMSFAAGSK